MLVSYLDSLTDILIDCFGLFVCLFTWYRYTWFYRKIVIYCRETSPLSLTAVLLIKF